MYKSMTVAHQPTPVWKLEKYALLLLTISFGMKLTFSFVILSRHCALSNEIQYSSANKQTMHTLAANTFTRSDSPECPFSSTLVPPECDSRTFPENVSALSGAMATNEVDGKVTDTHETAGLEGLVELSRFQATYENLSILRAEGTLYSPSHQQRYHHVS